MIATIEIRTRNIETTLTIESSDWRSAVHATTGRR